MEITRTTEDWAWDIYINGVKSRWVTDRVTNRNDFKGCREYNEHMEMARNVIKLIQQNED